MRRRPIKPHPTNVLCFPLDRRRLLREGLKLGVVAPSVAALRGSTVSLAAQDAAGAGDHKTPIPPDAPRRSQYSLPIQLWNDPYRWLENPEDPEVIAYLEAENAYTAAMTAPTEDLQEDLYAELIGRVDQAETTLPTRWFGYFYYQRYEEGKDYEIICRKLDSLEAPEQILLDLNALPSEYIALSGWRPSPDNRYLAYGLDTTGEEYYQLYVMDMTNGQVVDMLPSSYGEWGPDSRTLYFCRYDKERGRDHLHRHTIGTALTADTVLYEEDDANYWLAIYQAKDRTHLFLESFTFDTIEVQALPLDQPDAELVPVAPRIPGVRHYLEHHGDEFLILTDQDAPNLKLLAAPTENPQPANWREVIPHRTNVVINPYGVEPFARQFVIYGREGGFTRIWVRDAITGRTMPIPFDEATYVVGAADRFTGGENWTFATDAVRIAYSSLVTPGSIYEIDLVTGERTLLKRWEVIGNHDPTRYMTERLFATAPDGTLVPISVVSLKDAPAGLPPGPRPMRLDGYGGYGSPMDPYFSVFRLALLERGVSYAIAHIRGGGEFGETWWEQGRLLEKKTCFSDFIACAEHLIATGRTAPDRLAVYGASNGGLLMGVVANDRPELVQVVAAEVPLADVVAALLLTSTGLANRDEFGDPTDPAAYAYQRSYSPYQNVTAQDYPAMIVTGGLQDTRTPFWQSAKWVAMLRDKKTDDNPLLLHMQMASGHLGMTGFSDYIRETAILYAFFLQELGLAGVRPEVTVAKATPPSAASRASNRMVAAPASSLALKLSARSERRGSAQWLNRVWPALRR